MMAAQKIVEGPPIARLGLGDQVLFGVGDPWSVPGTPPGPGSSAPSFCD